MNKTARKAHASWPLERVDLLRRLCETTDLSAVAIADRLGFSGRAGKSTVIGKAHRLGITLPSSRADDPGLARWL